MRFIANDFYGIKKGGTAEYFVPDVFYDVRDFFYSYRDTDRREYMYI